MYGVLPPEISSLHSFLICQCRIYWSSEGMYYIRMYVCVSVIPYWTVGLNEEGGKKKSQGPFRSQPQPLLVHLPIALGLGAGRQNRYLSYIYIEGSQILDGRFSRTIPTLFHPFLCTFIFSFSTHSFYSYSAQTRQREPTPIGLKIS